MKKWDMKRLRCKSLFLCVIGGILSMGMVGCTKEINKKETNLISYSYSSSGGMSGGSSQEEINIIDGEVILTESNAEWWCDEATVHEYIVDQDVLKDIHDIVKKNKMEDWNQKEFTDMIVYDGPSYSYHFKFDDGTNVSFSSQAFPKPYSTTLHEISNVIDQYKEKGSLLPGLVLEDMERIVRPDHGRVELKAYGYTKGNLHFRILNGTNKDVEIEGSIKLIRNQDGKELYDREDFKMVYATSTEDVTIRLPDRLEEGFYTVSFANYSCEFEIQGK